MLESRKLLKYLEVEDIYIHYIDFTRDYKGVFNKSNLIKYLEEEHNFRIQGSTKDNDGAEGDLARGRDDDDDKEEQPTIMANNKYVGRNCLSFLKSSNNGTIRYKFYNKFVQSMESPGVRNCVGNHYADWCDNPEKELKKAIEASLETGILRLEITFYRLGTRALLTKSFVEEHLNYLANLIPPELLFHNPIATQWDLLLQNVHYNTCLIDLQKKLAFLTLYLNKETGKTNGFFVKDVTSNKLSNILKLYTFNTPIVVVLLERDKDDAIRIQQDTYIKTLDTSIAKQQYTEYWTRIQIF
jgi:hypothetical protein